MSGTRKDRDPFETGLGDALRRTGETFSADGVPLVDGGVDRGRRGVRRRRAAAVTGSVAALAVVGLGASYASGAFGHEPGGAPVAARPAASGAAASSAASAAGTGPQLSARQVGAVLEGLLPKGKITERSARGTGDPGGPMAALVHDDGRGKAAISVGIGAVDPSGSEAEEQVACPDKVYVPYDSCRSEKLPDGSRLMVLRGYEYPDKRVDTKWWHAYLVTRDGYTVDASEWNAPAEKDAATTRDEPPLSAAQLKALVTSKAWRPVMEALEKAPREPVRQPPAQGQDGKAILRKLTALLPASVKVTARNGEEGFAYVVVDDGKGASLVQINVQPRMSDVESDLFGGADVLPDGMKVVSHQGPGEKGGEGVNMWTVDTLRTDGLRVVISAFNSGAQNTKATREEPALTMAQLRSIATNPVWAGK
ncbi:hypothetical protein [Streptomyces sp. NPDC059783]|uniref:hypothetical protein n=1 Tax=Streptomyces sp. NPDC059783 TaxID=3346944 RepID=UPI003661CE18